MVQKSLTAFLFLGLLFVFSQETLAGEPSRSPCLLGGFLEGTIRADDDTIIPAALIKKPLVNKTHDCRTNAMSYPFLPDGLSKAGIWLTAEGADLVLKGDGWVKVDVARVRPGDIFLVREKKKITKIFKVLEASSDVLETNTYHLTLSYKPNDLIKKNEQFALDPNVLARDKTKQFEFWGKRK